LPLDKWHRGKGEIYIWFSAFSFVTVNKTKEHHKDEALTVSVEHAARLIGVSRGTAYRMVRDGELPAIRVGRRVLVLKKPLMQMLGAEEDTSRDEN
jgi:excisionase family DNA binding protein